MGSCVSMIPETSPSNSMTTPGRARAHTVDYSVSHTDDYYCPADASAHPPSASDDAALPRSLFSTDLASPLRRLVQVAHNGGALLPSSYFTHPPVTPKGADRFVFKFACPLCFFYYEALFKTDCCGHQVCAGCVASHIEQRVGVRLNQTAVPDESLPLPCPACTTTPVRFIRVRPDERPRSYRDSPTCASASSKAKHFFFNNATTGGRNSIRSMSPLVGEFVAEAAAAHDDNENIEGAAVPLASGSMRMRRSMSRAASHLSVCSSHTGTPAPALVDDASPALAEEAQGDSDSEDAFQHVANDPVVPKLLGRHGQSQSMTLSSGPCLSSRQPSSMARMSDIDLIPAGPCDSLGALRAPADSLSQPSFAKSLVPRLSVSRTRSASASYEHYFLHHSADNISNINIRTHVVL